MFIVALRLVERQKELEVFKKKDPPILTMEEMVDSVAAVEALTQLLAQDKQVADVRISIVLSLLS